MAYLKPDTKLEPVIKGWYTWCHLLAPVPLAMNFAHRYLGILQSFVANPKVHVNASSDPAMFGGPFVSLPMEARGAVADLKRTIEGDCAEILTLARETKAFDLLLQEQATGYSLEPLYDKVPPSLAGRIELVYDPLNHPRIRFIEELLAGSAVSGREHQSIIMTSAREEERDFFLSTPRLRQEGELNISVPFADSRLDLLARMRTEDVDLQQVAVALNLGPEESDLLAGYCSDTPPQRNAPNYSEVGVRIRYLGHACVLLQTADVSVLIDPLISSDGSAEDGRFSLSDLPDVIDYVVITHGHQDHLVPETLLQIRYKVNTVVIPRANAGNVVDPSLKLMLQELGFQSVRTVDPFDEVPLPGGRLVSLPFPGEHCDLDIYSRQGLYISLNGVTAMFMVDSRAVSGQLYSEISRRVGPVDMAFIGMECDGAPLTWLYGPLLLRPPSRRDDESRRMSSSNAEQAFAALRYFDCKTCYVYAMGQEPWLRFLMGLEYAPDSVQLLECEKLAALCSEAGMSLTRLNLSAEFVLGV